MFSFTCSTLTLECDVYVFRQTMKRRDRGRPLDAEGKTTNTTLQPLTEISSTNPRYIVLISTSVHVSSMSLGCKIGTALAKA
jgi:hypothetical protein